MFSGKCNDRDNMKICTKCKISKSYSEFYKQSFNSKDGYQSHCKKCDNVRKEKWKKVNPDKAKLHAKTADSNKYSAGRNTILARNKLWKQQNPEKVLAMDAKRRASILKRTPKWLTDNDFWMIEEAYELAVLRAKMFGFPWHVDHIIPLQGKYVSGLHVPSNLRVVPGSENLAKGNSYLI